MDRFKFTADLSWAETVRVPINLHKMSTAHACALNDAIKRKLPVLINETGSLPQHLCTSACELNANYVSQRQESFWHRSAKYLHLKCNFIYATQISNTWGTMLCVVLSGCLGWGDEELLLLFNSTSAHCS